MSSSIKTSLPVNSSEKLLLPIFLLLKTLLFLFSYDKWMSFNKLEFSYAECSTCSDRLGLSLIENSQGFLTEYSMSTPSEDMAEIFSFLMTDKKKLLEISKKDTIINKKISFLKEELLKIDRKFRFE